MANKVIKAQQMDFKTVLGRTLLKMGLERMKPKQVGVFYNSLALIVLSSMCFVNFLNCRKKLFRRFYPEKMFSLCFPPVMERQ